MLRAGGSFLVIDHGAFRGIFATFVALILIYQCALRRTSRKPRDDGSGVGSQATLATSDPAGGRFACGVGEHLS